MLGAVARKIFGSANDRVVKKMQKTIDEINGLEEKLEKLSDGDIKHQTDLLRDRLKNGEMLDDLLPEAFATVREAAKRTLGQRHYDVQLMGGIVLHQGKITEMKTGEGKTLVSTLAAYLNALEGKGVHVVTVNDYLAKRDSEWMGEVYEFLGLTTGCIMNSMDEDLRRAAYAADITYGTNNEFGFDYLRDNMKFRLDQMVQRPFNFAIIDEVDSILIDEARTPLIISGPAEDTTELYIAIDKMIPTLKESDFEKDEKAKAVTFTEDGMEATEQWLRKEGLLQDGNLYDVQNVNLISHANAALRAHKLFTKDKDYIVKDGKVVIIDEFTGRMMEGRRYSEGLHQALEAKEKVQIQRENQTLASITFQNYFRMYPKLSGMTGTAMTEEAEFDEIYQLQVVEIPTHRDVIRNDEHDEIYRTAKEKYDAVIAQIAECQNRNQPVLVGTVSIEKSELLSSMLKRKKIKHEVLNARHHEREAYIVAQAGRPGAVTIATNMAGRGTDIQLGGNAEMLAIEELGEEAEGSKEYEKKLVAFNAQVKADHDKVLAAGGLYVIGTERHESRRIDNQLRGRSGRQGDPGASKFFLSLEDDLMRIFGTDKMDGMLQRFGLKEGEAIIHPWINKALERAQEKVEASHFEIRKNLLKFDNVMNDQRKVIYEQRRDIMQEEDLSHTVKDMRTDVIEDLVARAIPRGSYAEQWNMDLLHEEMVRIFGEDLPVKEWAEEEGIADEEIIARLTEVVDNKMAKKVADGSPDIMRAVEKSVLLQVLDQIWKEHLLSLDHLRQGISLRAYAQKDPLNEYKQEAFGMFGNMLDRLRETVTLILAHVQLPSSTEQLYGKQEKKQEMHMRHGEGPAEGEPQQGAPFSAQPTMPFDPNNAATWGKTGRNEACPCGSGKKYKHCHGKI